MYQITSVWVPAVSYLCCLSVPSYAAIFNMLQKNLRGIELDHTKQQCVVGIGFCQEHIEIWF